MRYAREEQKREPYDAVLIVCEGGKTEPKYLQELRDALKLSTANIRIAGDLPPPVIGSTTGV